ncbi:MAG: acetyl-CoA carboxylase biotin carboxylase subunit [Deltaproteobacteria bacterium]|nr:acetyl-CoA carboxylase biotin carboxylase subunit [Deltaproteobacteria bacterium]
MFKKILIANRGEIAVRIIRACRELGVSTVAVFSEIDREALHVRMADEAYLLGPAPASESYLRQEKILEVARRTGAEAIHPGYGFLSENADFSDACKKAGVQFIGPSGSSMRMIGDKIAARQVAAKVRVPTVPGMMKPLKDSEEAKTVAKQFGYPVLLKARAGGGGKGMRKVSAPGEITSAFQLASSEARQSFGDPALYLEKYIQEPHHIEVQILGDRKGNVFILGERECSIQRRHQKIIEESPSPFVTPATRKKLFQAAVKLARAARYENAGTLEFLVDKNQKFYFLEMNARLQVEHPVTEQVTGIDLVRSQIQVAAGKALTSLPLTRGIHSMECRIYAEDPDNNFMPSPGKITHLRNPEGPGVRVDSAVHSGSEISVYYDPMIAKLITWGNDRHEAVLRMQRALREYQIVGVKTNLLFHEALLSHPVFQKGRYDTGFVERSMGELKKEIHSGYEEIARLSVEIHRHEATHSRSLGSGLVAPESFWKREGRREGLR